MKVIICILLMVLSCMAFAQNPTKIPNWDKAPNSHRADWMAEGNYGLMVHYLPTPQGATQEEKTKDFNNIINNFDMNKFMDAFDKSGADWLIFTIGQNVGYWNSPNPVVDNAIKGRTPDRDLVLEVAKEVKKRGKRFIAYLPGEAAAVTSNDPSLTNVFHWTQSIGTPEFYATWAEFLKNYSDKFGKNCDGWWIDGIYSSIHNMNYDWSIWANAMRSGNPDSAVALSDASYVMGFLDNLTPENDYFPGEVHAMEDGYIRIDPIFGESYADENGHARLRYVLPKFFVPKGPFLDGARLHALVPFDSTFNPNVKKEWCEYSAEDLILLTHSFHDVGGGVTLNAPINMDGSIPDSTVEKLIAVNKSFKDGKKYKLDPKVLERSSKVQGKNPNPKNIAWGKPSKLMNQNMTEEIISSGYCKDAFLGNDGYKESFALGGGGNWAWAYVLDLEKVTPVKEIKFYMNEEIFATEFEVLYSNNGEDWEEIDSVNNEECKKEFSWKFKSKKIRYIAIKAIKPNGQGQKGGQMTVAELEVYK